MKRHLTVFLLTIIYACSYAQEHKSPQIAVKTNALGWAMAVANVSAEIDIADDWSVNLPIYYSGADYFKETLKCRIFTFQPEFRYHIRNVSGLFVGAHLGIGWFNIAYGDWRVQDNGCPAYGGGFGVGYKLPFKKNPRWAVEFSLGAGIYDTHYNKFYNEANGPLYKGNVHEVFVGIDNAAVTFLYSIDLR